MPLSEIRVFHQEMDLLSGTKGFHPETRDSKEGMGSKDTPLKMELMKNKVSHKEDHHRGKEILDLLQGKIPRDHRETFHKTNKDFLKGIALHLNLDHQDQEDHVIHQGALIMVIRDIHQMIMLVLGKDSSLESKDLLLENLDLLLENPALLLERQDLLLERQDLPQDKLLP